MAEEETPAPGFDAQVNVKMSRELRARLRKIEARHGTPVPEILRRLGAAAAEFFDRNGYLTFPASIVPETFPPPSPRPRGATPSRAGAARR
ncbi:MAG: hypothetical protein LBM92_05380 [Opitutaceae bacterium]|jgi:hypothetical protein|nr:hypothetical protein [Opitutaceae bacterium]